ncbi:primosomal protein N' [Roseomonas marmotae]|uniref:Replication restart protein PriA n=1 Tax=Roseomonas marmotae TaxID=2768161 RepID=A0ABS3K7Y8_9PROT|nr:primosomal protein N' [Roseomonas marmotae]MBO1073568.1 primosomal protein N' [Roseomonas marmotae]QTI80249.1 primosomal protein N' [Roseomonas marmotae]
MSAARRKAGGSPQAAPRPRLRVLLPLPLAGAYDYRVPAGMEPPPPGTFVQVPLGGRETTGVVWDGEADPELPERKLRDITHLLDVPPMTASLRRFVEWVAAYTVAPPGAVLRMAMSSPSALEPPMAKAGWRVSAGGRAALARGKGLTGGRQRVLETMLGELDGEAHLAATIVGRAGVSSGVLRGMADAGLLEPALIERGVEFPRPDLARGGPGLSEAQRVAAEGMRKAVASRSFGVTLLSGVTGSGKTEVYLEAVAECLAQGRQALVLLPEIALSAQWLERFEARFGCPPALWHSELGSKRRRDTWRALAEGRVQALVGARSALFLPFPDLGLIVVDEEHETAFKQEDGVIYHARDMAVVRARLNDAACVLASATPSLETLTNVETGRYSVLHLPTRHGGATLPSVETIDQRVTPPERGRFLSPPLVQAVRDAIERGEQAMLFLNRRGYAPLTLCRTCGHRMRCPNCTAWLVEHRVQRRLQCHHCGHAEPIPPHCPECGAEGSLTPLGPGVERVQEEAAELFPDARRLVMASDTLPGPAAAAEAARAISAREVDLIIGTQIVAKGWHFPHLTLVGVVDADLGLAGGDLRAAERTVQLLHQVAGRAGRAEAPGRVLLQSWNPEHPVMQALISGDLDGFMRAEAEQRRPGHWPPFGRLAALIVSAEDEREADTTARDLGIEAPGGDGVEVLGPAPAPLAMLRGRHRRRLLIKVRRDVPVQPLLREWLSRVRVPASVKVQVDVDPVSFL